MRSGRKHLRGIIFGSYHKHRLLGTSRCTSVRHMVYCWAAHPLLGAYAKQMEVCVQYAVRHFTEVFAHPRQEHGVCVRVASLAAWPHAENYEKSIYMDGVVIDAHSLLSAWFLAKNIYGCTCLTTGVYSANVAMYYSTVTILHTYRTLLSPSPIKILYLVLTP